MNETLFLFNMPSSDIIDYKGKKFIIVKTQNQEKLNSALLYILADGSKFPQYLIYKVNKDSA